MSMKDLSIEKFAEELAAKTSVPGGGGAAALTGALAAALGSMVGNFTLGKEKYKDAEPLIEQLMTQSGQLRNQLLACIEKDAVAFEPLSKAYGLPKDAPGRDETLEKCLKDAAAVPMEIADLCCAAIELSDLFAQHGSKLMISDAGCSAALAAAALKSAGLNVLVNTKLMKDRAYAEAMNDKLAFLMENYIQKADMVYEFVLNELV